MKGSFFPLFKAQAMGLFGINKALHKNKKTAVMRIFGIILAFVVIVVIANLYLRSYAESFYKQQMISVFLPFLLITVVGSLSFINLVGIKSATFGFKDYEMVKSLPVKKSSIVLSKFIYFYLFDFFISLFVFILALIHYTNYVYLGTTEYVYVFLIVLAIPFAPIFVGTFFGMLVSLISSKMKHKGIVDTIIYVIFFAALLYLAINISGASYEKLFNFIKFCQDISVVFTEASYSLILVGGGLVLFIFTVYVTNLVFDKLNSFILNYKTSANFKVKKVKQHSQKSAIVRKEFRTLFSHSVLSLNVVVVPLISAFFSIFIAIIFRAFIVELFHADTVSRELSLIPIVVLLFGFMVTPYTACAISVEGRNFWIMKSSAIEDKTIISSKLVVHFAITLPVSLACAIAVMVILGIDILFILLMLAAITVAVSFAGIMGLYVNLKFPMTSWENINEPVKKSMSVFLTMIISLVTLGGIGWLCKELATTDVVVAVLVSGGIYLVLAIVSLVLLYTDGVKSLSKIS